MKMVIPKQHGAWAMLLIPFLLGMLAGHPTIWHIPLLIGWLFLYLATFPFIMFVRKKKRDLYGKWALIYGTMATISLIPILFIKISMVNFGLVMIPLFLVNIYFAKKNKERAFLNDLVAILVFCIGGLASYYLGTGKLSQITWYIFSYCFLYFLGTTFYVKTMIREKNNLTFKYYSWGFHLLLPFIILGTNGGWAVIAYIPSILRAFILNKIKLSVMQIGIIEIINSLFFFITMLLIIY